MPAKTACTYKTDSFDKTGLTLEVTYSDGSKETKTDTSKIKNSGCSPKQTGEQTLTIEYEDCTATFNVSLSLVR